jgi:hypothetical protein
MSIPYYRILWEEQYGNIPIDENGRSFEIHHINGDHSDDRIENLQCLSIKDHFAIHEAQGDILACCAISRRMALPPTFTDEQKLTLAEEARIAANLRVQKGTHNFLGGKIQKRHQARRKEEGTHNFINSNPNFFVNTNGEIETILTCINKHGQKIRIAKSIYMNQAGPAEEWEFAYHRSKEGLRRKATLHPKDN